MEKHNTLLLQLISDILDLSRLKEHWNFNIQHRLLKQNAERARAHYNLKTVNLKVQLRHLAEKTALSIQRRILSQLLINLDKQCH